MRLVRFLGRALRPFVRLARFVRRSFDRVIGWPYGSGRRDHSKSWFKDRADRQRAATNAPKPPEATNLPQDLAEHMDNVWLAIGGLAFVGGVGLVTAAWLGHTALLAVPGARPGTSASLAWWDVVLLLGFLVFGLMLMAAAGLVFASFFYERLRLKRPATLREQQWERERLPVETLRQKRREAD
jgi:hypothetical protein